ncbi:TRAP transporter substrate-binding protein [Microbaculum marinisediminis]|uniref:TRAP transporter substrate-binding protein n=1 Tax=Microbaculum marinisediminis TaxID=2931392 RepID=A0AAW5R5P4_9HYPH|nr:TRAP transporter substrate-binding protein [Microbaculum sp. A6E488]MCT8974228.1 TRAP transporter substrate-binding protein [Microbaculum sp. A6E488]
MAQSPDVTIRLGHVAPEENIYHYAATHFAERVAEYTDGTVAIEVYPGAQLGGDRDLLEGVQLGTLEGGYISLAIFESMTPVLTGFQMPFLIDSYDTAYKADTSEVAADALATLEDYGIKGLAIVENGMRVPGNTVRPIRKPSDFEGIDFRAPEAGLQLRMFELLGANVIPMPFPEIYTALQTGVLEGQDQFLQTWVGTKAYEIVDYMSLTQMYTWPTVITINLAVFESLTKEQQAALERAARETQTFAYEKLPDLDKKAIGVIEEAGIEVERDIDLAPFMETLSVLYDEYAEKDPLVARTIETIRDLRGE